MSKNHPTRSGILREIFENRLAGWILFAITAFILAFVVFAELTGLTPALTVAKIVGYKLDAKSENANKPESPIQEDSLGIGGRWTYETDLKDDRDPNNEFIAFKGENTVISVDRYGYTMQGQRTAYKEKNSDKFMEYEKPIPIEF